MKSTLSLEYLNEEDVLEILEAKFSLGSDETIAITSELSLDTNTC